MEPLLTTILLATDGSPAADEAGRAAIALADRTGAALHVASAWSIPREHATTISAIDRAYLDGLYEERARAALAGSLTRLEAAGATIAGAQLVRGRAADAILAEAATVGADLIVTGSRGCGQAKRVMLGSVAEGVVRGATCPVLVVRGADTWPPARVIIGSDGSPEARRAAELAADFGRASGAAIILVRAVPPLPPHTDPTVPDAGRAARLQGEALRHAERELAVEATALAGPDVRRAECLATVEDADIALLRAADAGTGPTLIAVGTRGTAPAGQLWLGSTALRILTCAEGAVLICPHRAVAEE